MIKDILAVFILCALSLSPCYAGPKFAGIEWGTPVSEVATTMEERGFSVEVDNEGDTLFRGELVGRAFTCVILERNERVVGFNFSFHNSGEGFKSWITVKPVYSELKNVLSKKYGSPKVLEFFKDPYEEGDGYEFQALDNDKGFWMCFWESDNDSGSIALAVSLLQYDKAVVHLAYTSPQLAKYREQQEQSSESLF